MRIGGARSSTTATWHPPRTVTPIGRPDGRPLHDGGRLAWGELLAVDPHLGRLGAAVRRRWRWVIGGIGSVGGRVFSACTGGDRHRHGHVPDPAPPRRVGRPRSVQTRKGNAWLRAALVAAGQSAARIKHSYLGAQYRCIATRRGAKRAILAVAHAMLIIAYHLIARREPDRELGADYFDRQQPAANHLVRRLRQLGDDVVLTTIAPTPAAEAVGGVP